MYSTDNLRFVMDETSAPYEENENLFMQTELDNEFEQMIIKKYHLTTKIKPHIKEQYEKCVNPLTSLEIQTLLYETFRTKDIADLLSKYTISEVIELLELQMIKETVDNIL